MKRIILLIFMTALLACVVNATDWKCYTMVKNGTEVLQINPDPTEIYAIGIIDYFTPQPENSKYQYVQVYFSTEDLRHNRNVNFSVICSGNNQTITFERNVIPQIKPAEEAIDWVIWLNANIGYIVVLGVIIAILLIVVFFLWRFGKG